MIGTTSRATLTSCICEQGYPSAKYTMATKNEPSSDFINPGYVMIKQIPTWLKNYSWLRIHILTSIRSQLTRRSPKLKSLNENILANTFTHFRHVPSPSVFNFLQLLLLNFWGFIAMFKGIAPPSLSISGHLKEIMRMKSWLTCWKEQVDTVNCLSNIWIKKSRSVGTNCCGVSALVLQLWLLSRFSCLAQMLDPDSYYQNGHELMKEKLIASSLVLQDKGFIAMSKDSVTPSPMTQNNCSVSTRTLIRNSFTTGSDQRGQFRDPRCGVERAKRGAFGLRTYDLKLGEPPTSQVWQRRTTPPWQCLPDAPFVGEWSKAAIRGVQGKPIVQENPEGKGTGYTGMRTTHVPERTRTGGSWSREKGWTSKMLMLT